MTAAARERLHTFFVIKESGMPDRILVWDTQDVTVGRSSENDVATDNAELSRQHAVFSRMGDAHVVKDLGTSNGTFVNDQPIQSQKLENKDVVRVASLEFHFYRIARNPASLGHKFEYASQLKQFGLPRGEAQSPEATMLGLVDPIAGPDDDEFEVRPARDFEYDLHDLDGSSERAPAPRNLDLEIDPPSLDELDLPPEAEQVERPEQTWSLDEAGDSGTLSVRVEIGGLPAELRHRVESLIGKVIQLPSLRIRLQRDDRG
jgi:hypothetical protein